MNSEPADFADLWIADRGRQNIAYTNVLQATSRPVGWAPRVWADVVDRLTDPDNHNRAIAAQVLSNLSISAPDQILEDFVKLTAVTRDERFVTARHCLQALWRIGTISSRHLDMLLRFLTDRYRDCLGEKNATLIRADIIEVLAKIDATEPNAKITDVVFELIASEPDDKYRRKYAAIWRRQSSSR